VKINVFHNVTFSSVMKTHENTNVHLYTSEKQLFCAIFMKHWG